MNSVCLCASVHGSSKTIRCDDQPLEKRAQVGASNGNKRLDVTTVIMALVNFTGNFIGLVQTLLHRSVHETLSVSHFVHLGITAVRSG